MRPWRVVIFGWAESAHVQRWTRALADRGWNIRLISLGGKPVPGVETFVLPRRGRFSYIAYVFTAVKLAREFRPHLVHVHYAGGFGFWGANCRFAPLVVSVWGADVIDLPRKPIVGLSIQTLLGGANRITATSEYLRQTCIQLRPETGPRITVIPFGVNVPDTPAPLPPLPLKLCFIKAHRPKYGPDILLRALARVRGAIPDVRMTLAGEGEMTPALRTLTAELGLEAHVDFVGLVPNKRIYSLLEAHHVMIMPSVMESESFGVAVLEAAACGRTSIASNIGGVPEVIRDGETGLLVPPGDPEALAEAIVRLGCDRDRIEKMGIAAHLHVGRNYRWEDCVDQMTALYESVIRG
ncbi:MAG: glycosyltransferase family 4 protein [Candidatus Zixiibacteriota bacterium]